MKQLSVLILIIIAVMSCTEKNVNPEKWNEAEINSWFEKQDWLGGWKVQPDASINRKSLAVQYFKNQRHWDQAFNFLKSSNIKNMPVGRQELEGDHLFVIVDEYISKEKAETRFESHKKYIDIQYVISGKELMGLTTEDNVTVTEPYNAEKDIAFYDYDEGKYILATPSNFLIFFSDDIHRPTIKAGENETVKKIVVKILVE
ncbi:MAG: YhcH/YjgK/YiaL family protein [Prolixibacteraceae bacterium]|nr:YhcH/YjgK/YiaL family protein [Prolixibacteraceae bacterium]